MALATDVTMANTAVTDTGTAAVAGAANATPTTDAGTAADKVARERAEREAAYWRGIAEGRGEGRVATTAADPPVADKGPGPEPKFENFATVEEFQAAREKWLLDTATDRVKRELRQEDEHRRATEKQQTVKQKFDAQLAEAAAEDPEIHMVTRNLGGMVNGAVADLIVESEMAPKLIRHLYSNPAKVAKLNQMAPMQIARELGKLELEITKESGVGGSASDSGTPNAPTSPASTTKKDTSAPAPITTVQPGAAPSDWDDDRTSVDDWMAKRNEQAKRR